MSHHARGSRASGPVDAHTIGANSTGSDNECTIYLVSRDSEFCGHSRAERARYDAETIARFWAKVNKTSTCWLWTGARFKFGHGQSAVRVPGKKWRRLAHRVAWELTHGPIPDGLCVCHRCDVPACCRPDHLFLGTQQDNLNDARRKGRLDESLPRTKVLTPEERLTIYGLPNHQGLCTSLARTYGVSKACISLIRRGRFKRPLAPVFERVPSVQLPVVGAVS